VELKDYVRPLRRWWWLILAAALIATTAAYLVTRRQPPIYSTRTTVMVGNAIDNPNPNGYEFYLTQQLANTYADIASRENVRSAVQEALGLEFVPPYTARVVPNTQLVELVVTDTDPQRARAVAEEVVRQLSQLSPTGQGTQTQARRVFIEEQLGQLESNIRNTQAELTKRQDQLATLFSARQIADAQATITGLQNKLGTLQANYAALLANTQEGALNAINVIEPAALPATPIGPNRLATILMAAAIGMTLAIASAYILEYMDDTLKNPDDVKKSLGVTTLGAVPRVDGAAAGSELAIITNSQSSAAEAYRVLRTNLQFAAVDRPLNTLLVTSPAPSEGKSMTIANLSAALAQAGQKVIAVDTDLHRPRMHKVFGLRNNLGVTTALLQEHPDIDGLLQETALPNLRVMTAGPLPPNPAELLGSQRMQELMRTLKGKADIVLFDSPPVTALSDTAILSAQMDGVLLVVDAGSTRRDLAKRALEALTRVNAHVVGVLLNRMSTQSGGGYSYYYQYGDYYRSGDGTGKGGGRARGGRNGKRRAEGSTDVSQPVSETGP
jgi:non-specific protein-tyrosine kinase